MATLASAEAQATSVILLQPEVMDYSIVQSSNPGLNNNNLVGLHLAVDEGIQLLHQDIQATHNSIYHNQAMLVKQLDNIMRTFDRKFNQLEATNEEFKSLITQHVNTLDDQFQIVKDHLALQATPPDHLLRVVCATKKDYPK